jgi:hypothetical protein
MNALAKTHVSWVFLTVEEGDFAEDLPYSGHFSSSVSFHFPHVLAR